MCCTPRTSARPTRFVRQSLRRLVRYQGTRSTLHPWTQSRKPVVRIGPSRCDNECAQKLHVPSNEPSAKNLLRHQYTCSQHPRSKIAVGACGAEAVASVERLKVLAARHDSK